MPNPKATPSFDEALAAAAGADSPQVSFDDALASVTSAAQPGAKAGLIATAASKAVPAIATGMEALATSPNVPKVAATVGRAIGGVAPVVGGIAEGGPMGGLIGLAGAAKGAWLGGKTGWFSGKLAQSAAMPVAKVLDAVAPYAQSLATLGGAQSLLDLAQVAEPTRQDIGTLGMSIGQPRSDAEKTAHPALLNMLASKVQDGIAALMHYGLSREDAVKAISDQTIRR